MGRAAPVGQGFGGLNPRQTARRQFSYGGTEAHIPGDYRYGVCVTETGSSITANGLKIIGKLFESHTVLIANPVC